MFVLLSVLCQTGGARKRRHTARTDLALQLALLPQPQVLRRVSHNGERGLGVMSESYS